MSNFKRTKARDKIKAVKMYNVGTKSIQSIADELNVSKSTVYWWLEQYKAEGKEAFTDSSRNNRTYSAEIKMAAARDYINGLGTQAEICKKYKIRSKHQLRDWVKMYNSSGTINKKGGSYLKASRETTLEERLTIVEYCLDNNKDYSETALKFNVSYQQVRNWVNKFEQLGASGLEDRRGQRKISQHPRNELEEMEIRVKQLEYENKLLTVENKLLKKVKELERRNADIQK